MKKRFTDTEKWLDPWFRKLSPKMKCAWMCILDTCDNCGVWKTDYELMSFKIGDEITEAEFFETFGSRLHKINDGKIWIKSYIEFQVGELVENCRPHKQIIELLKKHGIYKLFNESQRVLEKYNRVLEVSNRLQEQEKEKDKEKNIKEQDAIEIYNTYPSQCHIKKRSIRSRDKDIKKIIVCLKKNSKDELISIIKRYISDCKKGNIFMQNFSTFLNNLPDYDTVEIEPKKKAKKWTCHKCGYGKTSGTCDVCGEYSEDDRP
jgi:hypothetical protein